jgi:hypothetical protein
MSRLSSQSRPRRGQAASSRISPRTSLLPALVRRSTASRPGRDAGSAPHASISASTTGCQASASSEASPAASLTAPDAGTEDPSRRDRTPRHLSAGTRGGRTRWPATRGCEERDAAERRAPGAGSDVPPLTLCRPIPEPRRRAPRGGQLAPPGGPGPGWDWPQRRRAASTLVGIGRAFSDAIASAGRSGGVPDEPAIRV